MRFPVIALCDSDEIPVFYPKYERWLINWAKELSKAAETLRKKSRTLCTFLNFVLHETNAESVEQVTLNHIKDFLIFYQKTETGDYRDPQEWERGIGTIYIFLCHYQKNNPHLSFNYRAEDLISTKTRKLSQYKTAEVNIYSYFGVKPIKKTQKKVRYLPFEYLEVFLWFAKIHDPMIAFGVMLQAYAGLRKGEVLNLTRKKIKLRYGGFGQIDRIILDLTQNSVHQQKLNDPAFIKIPREQLVYFDFTDQIEQALKDHEHLLSNFSAYHNQYDPIFLNSYGRPMSKKTYSQRIRNIFENHFIPFIKETAKNDGTWYRHAPFIEKYEKDYPGTHMFRHWFTMFLLTVKKLPSVEIAKWRGDTSTESMATYVHINSEMIELFSNSVNSLHQDILNLGNKK